MSASFRRRMYHNYIPRGMLAVLTTISARAQTVSTAPLTSPATTQASTPAVSTAALAAAATAQALAPSTATAPASPLDALVGEWVRQSFVDTLKSTRSPLNAVGAAAGKTAFSIAPENGGYVMRANYNFHEGDERRIVNLRPSSSPGRFALATDSENEPFRFFRWTEGKTRALRWLDRVKIGDDWLPVEHVTAVPKGVDAEALPFEKAAMEGEPFVRLSSGTAASLALSVLDGRWKDAAGRDFEFAGGLARWPGKEFRYQVGVDAGEFDCDYIEVPAEKDPLGKGNMRRYGFRWEGKKLAILPYVAFEGDACPERAMYVLERMRP